MSLCLVSHVSSWRYFHPPAQEGAVDLIHARRASIYLVCFSSPRRLISRQLLRFAFLPLPSVYSGLDVAPRLTLYLLVDEFEYFSKLNFDSMLLKTSCPCETLPFHLEIA